MRGLSTLTGFLLGLWLCVTDADAAFAQASDNMQMGNPGAPVFVVEYAAVTCPWCDKWEKNKFDEFKRRFIDTGRIFYELREATTAHGGFLGEQGYLVARCAGPSGYFAVVRELMVSLDQYDYPHILDWLVRAGEAGGLTPQQAIDCAGDPQAAAIFEARQHANMNATDIDTEVPGLPSFFINGHYFNHNFDLDAFDQAISGASR